MSNIINMPTSNLSVIPRVSVQVSEYRDVKDQNGNNTGSLFAVETLFTDGTWVSEGYFRILAVAKVKAQQVAKDRGADLLDESIWPNCKIGGEA